MSFPGRGNMTSDHSHKRAPHTTTKLLLAIALFATAAALVAYTVLSDKTHAKADSDATVEVHCTACQQQFKMPYKEYRRLSPMGTDVSGPIACPKCGAAASVSRIEVNLPGAEDESETSDTAWEEKPPVFDLD